MPTVNEDSKITRANFNDLIAKFNEVWTDDYSGQMFTPRATQNPNYTWANKGWGATTGRLGQINQRMDKVALISAGWTWAESQNYLEGQLVVHNANIWLSKSNHTSTNSNRPDVDPNTWFNYDTEEKANKQQHLDNLITYTDWSVFGNAVNAALIHCGLPIIPSTVLPEQHKVIRGIVGNPAHNEFYYNMVSIKIDQLHSAATNGFTGNGNDWTTNGTFYYRGLTRKATSSAEITRLIGNTETDNWGVTDYRTFESGRYPDFKYNNHYDGDPIWAQQGKWQVGYVRLEFDNQTKLRHFLNQGGTITIYPFFEAHASPQPGDAEWQNIVGEIGTIEFGGMHVRRIPNSDTDSATVSRADYLQSYGTGGLMSEYVGSGGGSAQGAWKTWVNTESQANAYWEDTNASTMTYTQVYANQYQQNHTTFRRRYCSQGCGAAGADWRLQIVENGVVSDVLQQSLSSASDGSLPVEYYQGAHRYTRGSEMTTWTEVIPDSTPGGGNDTHYEYKEYQLTKHTVGFTVGSEEDYAGPNAPGDQFLNLGSTPLLETGNYVQGARRRLEIVSRLGPGGGDNWYIDCGLRLFNKSENKYRIKVGVKGYYTNVQASMYPESGIGESTTVITPDSFSPLQDASTNGDPPTVTALDSAAGTWS